tara:strand:- start:43 stop:468 length:426 start_codon:yes stop_codon:yes gene_type:complete
MKINKNIIKELSDYLDEFDLTEIEYTDKDLKVKVSKLKTSINKSSSSIKTTKIDMESKNTEIHEGIKIPSPIIGTAYLAPEPGGKKFADVGKKIKKGDTIMIVEAMKTMNHVPCPSDGVIKEICVEDGQPVEYGQTIAILN